MTERLADIEVILDHAISDKHSQQIKKHTIAC
jgi:hypothetical protein